MSGKQQCTNKEIPYSNMNFELTNNPRYSGKVPTRTKVENINYHDNNILNLESRKEYNRVSSNRVVQQFKTFHEMDNFFSKSKNISTNNQNSFPQNSRNNSKGKLIVSTGNIRSKSPNINDPKMVNFESSLEKIEEYIPHKFKNPILKEVNGNSSKFTKNKSTTKISQKITKSNGKSEKEINSNFEKKIKDCFAQNEREKQIQKHLEKLVMKRQKSSQCLKININSTNQNFSNNLNSNKIINDADNDLKGKKCINHTNENTTMGMDLKKNENSNKEILPKNLQNVLSKSGMNLVKDSNTGFKEFEIENENVFKEVVNIKNLIQKAHENSSKGIEKKKISNQQR